MPTGVEQTVNILVPQIILKIWEVVQCIPQERVQSHKVEEFVDAPLPQAGLKQIVDAPMRRKVICCPMCECPTSEIKEDRCDDCRKEVHVVLVCEACGRERERERGEGRESGEIGERGREEEREGERASARGEGEKEKNREGRRDGGHEQRFDSK